VFPDEGHTLLLVENCIINNIGTFAFDLVDGCNYNRFIKNTITTLPEEHFAPTEVLSEAIH